MDGWLAVGAVAKMEEITTRAIRKRIKEGKYPKTREVSSRGGNGGRTYQIHVSCLSPELQKKYVAEHGIHAGCSIVPQLSPEASLVAAQHSLPRTSCGIPTSDSSGGGLPSLSHAAPQKYREQRAGEASVPSSNVYGELSADVLSNDRVGYIARFVQEALRPQNGTGKTKHLRALALREGIHLSTAQRWMKTYREKGHAGLKHTKSTRGQSRAWDEAAIDFWTGLCLKGPHRKIDKGPLYECLCLEAAKRSWRIGSYSSALWWYRKRVIPQFEALQKGGLRALDNLLPPVVRDYSDLMPFEILVGDQHRFDFWVTDEETGEVFRPEGYFWQDLRTRGFYGGAIAKKYDAQLMGLALRMGMRVFGPFGSIYTDNGRPEESRYIMGVLKEMRALGLAAAQTEEIYAELDGADPEELHCMVHLPGSHTRAIVRNAKAKMIEGTFASFESILRNQLKVPGHVKDLHATQEEQETDQKEIERLARAGGLLTFREFVLACLKAMDFYNSQKPHRGVLREWAWKPKPKEATPMQCLAQSYLAGEWKPTRVSEQLIDMVFLPRQQRAVDRGRVRINKTLYGHDALVPLTGKKVDCRYDPLDPGWALVFHNDEFICEVKPVEYSSMKDKDLAAKKIAQKRALRRQFLDEYHALTSKIPDFIQYSQVPDAEKAAAIVGRKRRQQALTEAERFRPKTIEELNAEVEQQERFVEESRPIFATEIERYTWILGRQLAGKGVREDELAFVAQLEAAMDKTTFAFWQSYKEGIGLAVAKESFDGARIE
jgi:putative transposase